MMMPGWEQAEGMEMRQSPVEADADDIADRKEGRRHASRLKHPTTPPAVN
jgi:hypothetical protein